MSRSANFETDRRSFLQAGAITAAAMGSVSTADAQDKPAKTPEIPRRTLGKTGVQVTMLEQGTVLGSGFDRIMRHVVRRRRARLRHRQGLSLRAPLQEVVRPVARGPQADLPRHQGHGAPAVADAHDGR